MRPYACYHWWSNAGDPPAYKNLSHPILLSIASLRATSDIPIVIFDVSERVNDWAHFAEKLNFQVINYTCHLKQYQDLISGWTYLSRIYDLAHGVSESVPDCNIVMYADSDVFWLRNPLPFDQNPEKFVFNGFQSGFFYYDHRSAYYKTFYDIFDCYTRAAIHSPHVRKFMKQYVAYDLSLGVWDEMILCYMVRQHPELFNITSREEVATLTWLPYTDRNALKMINCSAMTLENSTMKGAQPAASSRGLLALLIKEFHDRIRSVLDVSELNMIFTKEEQDFYLSRQFGLFENLDRLIATYGDDDKFDIAKLLVE